MASALAHAIARRATCTDLTAHGTVVTPGMLVAVTCHEHYTRPFGAIALLWPSVSSLWLPSTTPFQSGYTHDPGVPCGFSLDRFPKNTVEGILIRTVLPGQVESSRFGRTDTRFGVFLIEIYGGYNGDV